MNRCTGIVKWYDAERGHGFVTPEPPGEEVFIHGSAIHGTGMRTLHAGDRVVFDVVETDVGPAAEGIQRTT
jgi:CspA family cold shock protein